MSRRVEYSPQIDFWLVIERVRDRFVDAGYPLAKLTRVEMDKKIDKWAQGKRTVAACSGDGRTIWLSPRLKTFDLLRQQALIAHEFGHAVQGFYGDVVTGDDDIERDADKVAEIAMKKPLFYGMIEGRLIQTFDPRAPDATRPRPLGLR